MEKSKYTIEIFGDNKVELINTLYGSIVELDIESQKKYVDILEGREIGKYKEEMELLLNEGILVESQEEEEKQLEELYERTQSDKNILQLVILTTTACNMQCIYCFEHLKPIFPQKDNIKDIMRFINDRYEQYPFEKLAVTWFGGEPLLNIEYIRELSTEIINFTEERGKCYEAFMITNGTLVTYELARELRNKWKVLGLQITVDGMRERHNKRRPYGKRDGFSIIMNHVREVHKEIQIVLRINVDNDNVGDVENLLCYLSECDDLKENVLVDFGKVVGDSPSCMSFSEFENERMKLNQMLEQYGFCYTLKHFSLGGCLISCSVLMDNAFVIYPNGDLYKCYEVAGQKEYCIGNVKDFREDYKNKIAERFQIKEECKECSKLPLCNKYLCPYRYNKDMVQCMHTDESIYKTVEIIKKEQFV